MGTVVARESRLCWILGPRAVGTHARKGDHQIGTSTLDWHSDGVQLSKLTNCGATASMLSRLVRGITCGMVHSEARLLCGIYTTSGIPTLILVDL
jgi:hypothetical protein